MKTKITLEDSPMDILLKMSEGNPGALSVCMQLLEKGGQIDPDSALGGLGPIMTLDTLNIYGSRIWMLYKDVCGESLSKMVAVIRGSQLGYVTSVQIQHAIENYGDGINVEEICAAVAKRLPRFNAQ